MALEESGIDLVVDGLNAFEQGLETASGAVEGLGSIAESVSAVGLEALGAAMDAVMSIASGGLTLALDLAAQGVTFLKDALIGGIAGAMDGEVAMSRLSGALNRLGDDAPITTDQASKLASEFQTLAGGSDDAVLSIIELGVRSQQISETEFPQFIQQALDLGEVLGNDEAAARLLTRAQEDAASILPQLRRANIIFTESEEDKIKALVAAGQNAEALEIINAKLAETTGGAAAQANLTAAGAWNLFTTSLGEAAETVGTALLPLITTVTGLLNDQVLPVINTLAASLANDLSAGVTAASGAIGGFVGFIQANLPAIQESFTTAWNSIMVATQLVASVWRTDLQPALAELFTAIFGQGPTAQEVIDGLLNAIVTGAQGVATWVAGTLVPAVKQFSNWITEEFTPRAIIFKEWLDTNIPIAIGIINDAITWFTTNILPVIIVKFAEISAWVAENWPAIQQTITEVINTISQVVQDVMNNLKQFWTDHGDSVMIILTGLWEGLVTLFTVGPETIFNLISTGLELIQTFWTEWGDEIMLIVDALFENVGLTFDAFALAFQGDWEGFGETIRLAWDNMWEAIKKALDSVIEYFNAIDWGAVGTAIMQGIADGIAAGSKIISDAAMAAAKAAFEAAKGFFGIESPSKLFRDEIGLNITEGWAEGIVKGTKDVVASMTSLAGASMPTLQRGGGGSMEIGTLYVGSIVLAAGALPVSSLGTNVNRSIGIAEQNNITLAPTYNAMRGDPPSLDDLGQLALAMT